MLQVRFTARAAASLRERKHDLESLQKKLQEYAAEALREKKHHLQILLEKWEGLSPIRKLQQGYAYVESQDGKNVSSIRHVRKGETLHIEVTDGVIHTEVTGTQSRIRPDENRAGMEGV